MLDILFLNKYVSEVSNDLINSRVDKIYQPRSLELLFSIRKPGETVFLRLDSGAENTHFRITKKSTENPSNPPAFCMLLRKYLIGSKILEVNVVENERIINFVFQGRHPNGNVAKWILSFEIMGKHSNVVFYQVDTLEVLGLLKPIQSSVRELKVGGQYSLPPAQLKLSEGNLNTKEFMIRSLGDENLNLDKVIVKYFPKASPILVKEFLYKYSLENEPLGKLDDNKIGVIIDKYKDFLQNIKFKPIMFIDSKGMLKDFYCMQLDHLNGKIKSQEHTSFMDLVREFYDTKESIDIINRTKSILNKVINQSLKKLQKKQKTLNKDLDLYTNSNHFKDIGDLLMANLHFIKKGMTSIDVINYFTSQTETIKLDPSLNPIQNSQYYYKKYSKAKRGLAIVQDNLNKVNEEILYLESLILYVETNTDRIGLLEIEKELEKEGYVKHKVEKGFKNGQNQKKTPEESKPLNYISSDGFTILVGRNNKQNDQLTLRVAKKDDVWFHVKGIPGSHVIIKDGSRAPENTLYEAALLAAYYSKGKLSSNVPVDYTEVKNVFKPKGAKPGMVNYVEYKTLFVTPSEENIVKMERT
ncbi:NFACT family protein [Alkalicella caledoniensis]|uniref:Rqc2 homolog RqcH n=1 Tax=Alkalicella caledoniensis TaxID=2731377 RepID=A0A7G9WCC2_ALKCA|nr:NFACT family protein [Alkalicella caledoniensis]QNO16334.1 NFACT family protein [Alkalicella caledoniensis]